MKNKLKAVGLAIVFYWIIVPTCAFATLIGSTDTLNGSSLSQQHQDTENNIDYLIEKYLQKEVDTIPIGKINIPDSPATSLQYEGFTNSFENWVFELDSPPGASGTFHITPAMNFIGPIFFSLKASNYFSLHLIDLPQTWLTGVRYSFDWDTNDIPFNQNPHALSHISFWTISVNEVPEPATLFLFGLGLLSLTFLRGWKKN